MDLKEAVARIVKEVLSEAAYTDGGALTAQADFDPRRALKRADEWNDHVDSDLANPDPRQQSKSRNEAALPCEACGGTADEGTCECAMNEKDAVDHVEIGSRAEVGGPTANIESKVNEHDEGDRCPECGGPPGKHDPRCPLKDEGYVAESARRIVRAKIREMKLGVAGRGAFDPGQKDDDDEDDETAFFLAKKKEEAPPPKKSGTRLSTTRRRSKSSRFR